MCNVTVGCTSRDPLGNITELPCTRTAGQEVSRPGVSIPTREDIQT